MHANIGIIGVPNLGGFHENETVVTPESGISTYLVQTLISYQTETNTNRKNIHV